MKGTLTRLPKIDWDKEVEAIGLEKELELGVKEKLKIYLQRMKNSSGKEDDEIEE